jgi:hypothetical protein
MEVAHLFQDQSCNHMVDVLTRCQHFSFQTHSCIYCIKKKSHVDVAQQLMWK